MNKIAFLLLILILAIGLPLFFKISESFKRRDGYSNYNLDGANGDFPAAQTEVLVQDTYPSIGKNQLSDNTASDIWWHYPIFTLGSYKQITNNIRYPNNPDEGTCMPASMCGALYHKKKHESIHTAPLNNDQPRVGFFNTLNCDTIITSLPYRTNSNNILY